MSRADVYASERLPAEFYERPVHELATDMLGRFICHDDGETMRVARIVETEAYGGGPDPACHGDGGVPTNRTRPMFGPPGVAYVYLIYGMYHCFNVVSSPDGTAAAVLVRAAEPVDGIDSMLGARNLGIHDARPATLRQLMSGPGKLCQALGITRDAHSGTSLQSDSLFIGSGVPTESSTIARTKRIGLNPKTVGDAIEWPWRYLDTTSKHLSR